MSKIHITLVGGQPAPVYHGIIATNPDKVVYIYSSNSKISLEALHREIALPHEDILLDPTDCIEILGKAAALATKYEHDDVTVNISSGLKSWSHFFGVVFERQNNAAVVYMDQNNKLWNYKTMDYTSGFLFDMHALFRLYGNELEHYKAIEEFTHEDAAAIPLIESMRSFNHEDFKNLASVLTKKQQNQLQQKSGRFTCQSHSFVEWIRPDKDYLGHITMKLYNNRGESKEFIYDSDNITDLVFNTAWFELKIALILKDWEKSREVCLNCRFPFKKYKPVDKNEVDIIVNTGNKILFVECKTQINKPTDIDKFGSVVKNYGGSGSKGIFITDAPISDVNRKKCEENKLLHFSLQESGTQHAAQDLYNLLDSELFKINA